jgi:hypothetical protein
MPCAVMHVSMQSPRTCALLPRASCASLRPSCGDKAVLREPDYTCTAAAEAPARLAVASGQTKKGIVVLWRACDTRTGGARHKRQDRIGGIGGGNEGLLQIVFVIAEASAAAVPHACAAIRYTGSDTRFHLPSRVSHSGLCVSATYHLAPF